MSLVLLVSGGLDSSVMSLLANKEGLATFPLFVDYGQRSAKLEWSACLQFHRGHRLPRPERMDLQGFGRLIKTGLTSSNLDVRDHAFVPGRNLLFLLAGSAYAQQIGAAGVGIGLLREETHIFPDQTKAFLASAQDLFCEVLGRRIRMVAPLMGLDKRDVIRAARILKVQGTYSCHCGGRTPCGRCIACREFTAVGEEG